MNKYVKLTGIAIGVILLIGGAYDIWVMAVGGKDASISQVLINYFYDYPVASFGFGVVSGHLVWRMPNKYKITKEEYDLVLKHRGR